LPLLKRELAVNPRQLFSLLVVPILIIHSPLLAADTSEQGAGWRASSAGSLPDAAGPTLSGTLFRNSADQNGAPPYTLTDRWGVVRGYVKPAQGVDLEASVGQQVSLQGSIKTLPGGDMPFMVCERVLGGNAESANAQPAASTRRAAAEEQRVQEIAAQPDLPTRNEMSANPAPRAATVPLREVVLEPQADDNSRAVPAPHRKRRGQAQATNYQETLPTPGPAGSMRGAPMVGDPELEPTPMNHGPMVSGRMVNEGPMVSEDGMVSEGPMVGGEAGCDTCGNGACGACNDEIPGWGPRRPLFCVGPTGIWVKADFVEWWEQGTHIPALVTTGPNANNPGYIGTPGTQVLFGDDNINTKSESGGRIEAGVWLNACATFGFSGEFFDLGDEKTHYLNASDGNPILSRPFYDVGANPPVENVELIAFPRGSDRSADGGIEITALTRFHGAGAHFLLTACRQEGCWTDECNCTTYRDRFRADFIAGYRYLDLEDQLGITEAITDTTANTAAPNYLNAFLIHDQFNTQNSFNGGDLGMKFEFVRNRWSLDLFPRIALGSTHATADISGYTRNTNAAGVETTAQGGLLTQPANVAVGYAGNIGHFAENTFAVVPELDVNVGYQFTRHTRVVLGYSGMYWSSVARAGEQIDRSVNSTLLAFSGATPSGDLTHPQFSFQNTGFWAQGFNVGLDCRW
jgi:hypothetical protein